MELEEERLIFSSLIALNIFFIATILYLVTFISGGFVIVKGLVFYTWIVISLAVFLRIASNFRIFKVFKWISYLSLVMSTCFQFYAILRLFSIFGI